MKTYCNVNALVTLMQKPEIVKSRNGNFYLKIVGEYYSGKGQSNTRLNTMYFKDDFEDLQKQIATASAVRITGRLSIQNYKDKNDTWQKMVSVIAEEVSPAEVEVAKMEPTPEWTEAPQSAGVLNSPAFQALMVDEPTMTESDIPF